ncbi:MAG TPA: ATP-binding protein [Stellaceae bacterium]
MSLAANRCFSLRTLVIVMIGAPAIPALIFAVAAPSRLIRGWTELSTLGEVAVVGVGLRLLGGCAALLAAGWLICSIRALTRAAAVLNEGGTPAQARCGIAEIDNAIGSMADAARSLRERSRESDAAAAALRESEARLRDFAEIGSDWYWETGPDHRFTYTSVAIRQFGQDPDTRLGRTRQELASPDDTDGEKWAEHRRVLDRHEPFRDFVYTRQVGDQPEQVVSVSGKPIFDADGRFLGYRGAAREITEAAHAERRLREAKATAEAANQAKSQFLANTSHELRTPLNAVIGFSEALLDGTFGPLAARQRESVGYILQSGEHLLAVINDILDLARVEVGRLDLQEEWGVDPRAIAAASAALLRERAEAGGLRLAVEIDDAVPRLVVDRTRLKQVLLNLLSNAVKFTDPGGSVVLAAGRDASGGAVFEVRDTGVGMTPAEIETALEPFGQIETGLARRHEGTGLGLPLARRLTELHQGSLSICSERGRGTTVRVTLPPARAVAVADMMAFPAPALGPC